MRFVLAIVSFLIAAALIALGVAHRTVLAGPDALTTSVESTSGAPLTVVDGETLNAMEGRQTLTIDGSGPIIAAYGRTADVEAWVGDAEHNRIEFDPETSQITSTEVRGTETTVPSFVGSDLWLQEYSGEDRLTIKVSLDSDLSFIIASDGEAAAPATTTLSWPLDSRTPLVGPLLAGGALMGLIGLILLIAAFTHRRRRRARAARASRGRSRPRCRNCRGSGAIGSVSPRASPEDAVRPRRWRRSCQDSRSPVSCSPDARPISGRTLRRHAIRLAQPRRRAPRPPRWCRPLWQRCGRSKRSWHPSRALRRPQTPHSTRPPWSPVSRVPRFDSVRPTTPSGARTAPRLRCPPSRPVLWSSPCPSSRSTFRGRSWRSCRGQQTTPLRRSC